MWWWSHVWMFTVLVFLLLSSSAQARKSGGKSKDNKWRPLNARKMQKRGFVLGCQSAGGEGGRIVSLSLAGVAGKCRGLTASMFVQMNSCMWKKNCTLKQDTNDRYMLKLYQGKAQDCILQKPKKFDLHYHCVVPNVPVIDLLSGTTETVKEWNGIVRSHQDHPWLYKDHQDDTLTLERPDSNAVAFVYTILTLRLYNDVLSVTPGGKTYKGDVTNTTPDPIMGVDKVTFRLEMARYSTGEEGFVICFQWMTDLKKLKDNACSGLVVPGDKPKTLKKPKGGRKQRGKGKGKKRQGKNRKRGRKTATPSP